MKYYQRGDSSFASLRKQIIDRATDLEERDTEYWIIGNDAPILIISLLVEPCYMLAPTGTHLGRVFCAHDRLAENNIHQAISAAKDLASETDMRYLVYHSDSTKEDTNLAVLQKEGFEIIDHFLLMKTELKGSYPEETDLEFIQVKSEDMRKRMLRLQNEYYRASEDETVDIIMKHMMDLPQEALDRWYDKRATYLAKSGKQIVGMVGASIDAHLLSSIAVAPNHRGKGFGKEIMKHVLNRMIELDCEQCTLRVHIDNKKAVNLYKSLGFETMEKGITATLWLE